MASAGVCSLLISFVQIGKANSRVITKSLRTPCIPSASWAERTQRHQDQPLVMLSIIIRITSTKWLFFYQRSCCIASSSDVSCVGDKWLISLLSLFPEARSLPQVNSSLHHSLCSGCMYIDNVCLVHLVCPLYWYVCAGSTGAAL